jgi:hypothetical protein
MDNIKYKIVKKYLNINFGNMEKYNAKYQPGIILSKNNNYSGIICVNWSNTMFIYQGLITELNQNFGINEIDSKLIIKYWVESQYDLKCEKIVISGDGISVGASLLIGNCNFTFKKQSKIKIFLKKFLNLLKNK